MLETKFGIEIELTGITREKAAITTATFFSGTMSYVGGSYGAYHVKIPDGRVWKVLSDASISCQRKENRRSVPASRLYSVEMVSPILTYRADIADLQGLVRKLKKEGGFTNKSCGIHVHLDGADHTPRSIWNFVNLVASRNDLFYKSLQIPLHRQEYCKKMDAYMVEHLNRVKPRTFKQIEDVWYEKYGQNRSQHYHDSRYYFLNLHSFLTCATHTVELRGFNSTLHAGKVRAYVVFALAMNNQALTQTRAMYRKVQSENEKFAMRVYLVRIGLSGEEFKSCRKHLYEHLDGNAAWRYGSRENCHSRRNVPSPPETGDMEETPMDGGDSETDFMLHGEVVVDGAIPFP